MLPNSTVLFDLDGTLVDTLPDLWSALCSTMEADPTLSMSIDDLRAFLAQGMIGSEAIARQLGIGKTKLKEMVDLFHRHYQSCIEGEPESIPFPGVRTCLHHLHEQGAKLAVCTNQRADLACLVLEKLDMLNYFELIAGWDTYAVHKPHPDHLLLAIKALGGVLERSVMVGDSVSDITAARAANISFVGVTFGYFGSTKLLLDELKPDRTISHFSNLPEVLDHLQSDTI